MDDNEIKNSFFLETQNFQEPKQYKTSYNLSRDPKFCKDTNNNSMNPCKVINRLKDVLLNEITAPSHIVSEILTKFSEIFLNKYLIFFNTETTNLHLDMVNKSFKSDINILMHLLKKIIEKWYMNIIVQNTVLAKSSQKRQQFIDTLINFAVFSNSNNIYYTLLNLYGLIHSEQERKLDSLMERLKSIRPEHLEVSPYFSLPNCPSPYTNVSALINEQSTNISPLEKFQIVNKIPEEIKDCIENYWEENDPNIPAEKLMIDPDQLLTIMLFCVLKARNCKIVSYLEFFKEFVNRDLLAISYYFITYEATVSYLLKIKEEEVQMILEKAK